MGSSFPLPETLSVGHLARGTALWLDSRRERLTISGHKTPTDCRFWMQGKRKSRGPVELGDSRSLALCSTPAPYVSLAPCLCGRKHNMAWEGLGPTLCFLRFCLPGRMTGSCQKEGIHPDVPAPLPLETRALSSELTKYPWQGKNFWPQNCYKCTVCCCNRHLRPRFSQRAVRRIAGNRFGGSARRSIRLSGRAVLWGRAEWERPQSPTASCFSSSPPCAGSCCFSEQRK